MDSPMLAFEMFELFESAGVPALVEGYLGEPGLITGHKTTLRKADPSVAGAWHQDGHFMGEVRALNLWLSLSRCGDESPGLDIVPRRFDQLVTTATDEAVLSYQVSQSKAEEAAGETGIIRPIFEPGDALFFDELFLHATGSDPSMPKPRYAIENWFFGSSGFPEDYAPFAV
jgi:ectoine hydroxylase-related dioxygenase (phytanoyl-CoA dioxygenase family)